VVVVGGETVIDEVHAAASTNIAAAGTSSRLMVNPGLADPDGELVHSGEESLVVRELEAGSVERRAEQLAVEE
jgi:hypothetical protein